jgi:hypothetical protein
VDEIPNVLLDGGGMIKETGAYLMKRYQLDKAEHQKYKEAIPNHKTPSQNGTVFYDLLSGLFSRKK